MKPLKSLIKRVTETLPDSIKLSILRRIAILPPALRSRALYAYAVLLSLQVLDKHPAEIMQTNMGISPDYRCSIPMKSDPAIVFGRPDFYYGEWDTLVLTSALCENADAFVDVGSFMGYYLFYIKNHLAADKPIYYFEPVTQYFECITQNVKNNNLSNVYGLPSAVGNSTGTALFYENLTYATCGSLTTLFEETTVTRQNQVPITTFTDFVAHHPMQRACVKVDIEGAEQQFIDGALGALDSVAFLIMEVLDSQSTFLSYMANEMRYNVYHIKQGGLTHCPHGTDDYAHDQWNWLFCRQEPDELRALLDSSSSRFSLVIK